ncbi:beta-lactamase family protein [Paenibacillus doosanensis]|uniref:serine hydrolase domain-containing protein n=1 Tax=Paenibacillus doosanensis TaxID=1229154 RepID=UPI00217F3F31|nr:serine hydrolase domain-containing protein [Paenibacillus doosanensis]MCS7463734.1 beta-lactamase family protein [Paenibacillus doosanensis]
MDNIVQMIERWIAEKQIPGAVLDISQGSGFRFQKAFGGYRLSEQSEWKPLTLDSLFDAASLTKVTATLPAAMLLVQQGKLELEKPLRSYIPEFRHPQVTIRHLLQHSSGLAASLYDTARDVPREVMKEIFEQELEYEPGTRVLYSDLGFILLGVTVERITGIKLNEFVRREIHLPLGMNDTMFLPGASELHRIAPTEPFKDGYVHGEVHDEKTYRMGGVTGSAGLFTTASDLAVYGRSWLRQEDGLLSKRWRDECLSLPFHGRGLGWEIWHGQPSVPSCGSSWLMGSFGHTGFTGTSLWIDPQHELVVVLLTNAVHYGRGNPLRRFRPIIHEAIYSSIIGG